MTKYLDVFRPLDNGKLVQISPHIAPNAYPKNTQMMVHLLHLSNDLSAFFLAQSTRLTSTYCVAFQINSTGF